MNLAAVILAAGYSSRMQDFKPLMCIGGRSLVAHCVGLFKAAGITDILIVTGYRGDDVAEEVARCGGRYVHNPDFDQGMFTSVCAAVRNLKAVDGFFMLPVDIPLIRPITVAALCEVFDGRTVTFPTFNGRRGHPPLIPGRLLPFILRHDGHGGLQALLEAEESRDVPLWDEGILLDADTADDFVRLTHRMCRLDMGEPAEVLAFASMYMPERGLAHGRAVACVARALGHELNNHGYNLDLDLLAHAALLHDVAKGMPQHEARGAELLERMGLGRLAGIVAAHRDAPLPESGRLTEKELVCLADKLVCGSRRVPVRQRFEQKLAMYTTDAEACGAIRVRMAIALALQALVERTAGRHIEDILAAA